jgi:radical SAM superfamily enzyme YgiQ (UPF0313 family)
LKILLITPCPPEDRRLSLLHIPQLSLAVVAGLTPAEHEVEIREEPWSRINFDGNYDLVGITAMTATAPRAYEISRIFREKGIRTILGGIHPTTLPEEGIKYADAVLAGEAENIWPELLADASQNKLKQIYRGAPADMSRFVTPRRDLIRASSGLFRAVPIETTRGCPNSCDFCTVTKFFGARQRHKPVDHVIRDISTVSEKSLIFLDDNITGDPRYAKTLFQELKKCRIKWAGQASVNIVKDPELVKLASESGCGGLLIGFESISEEGTKKYPKTLKSRKENMEAVKILQDAGIPAVACIIFGFDHDDPSIFDETVDFLMKSKVAIAQMTILTPFPGTRVFDTMRAEGRILSYDWAKYNNLNVVFRPRKMAPEQLADGFEKARKTFYSWPSIIGRFWPNWSQGLLYSAVNIGHRYHSRHDRTTIGLPQDRTY